MPAPTSRRPAPADSDPEHVLLQCSRQGGIGDPAAVGAVIALLKAFRGVSQAIVRLMGDETYSAGRICALVSLYALDPVPSSPAELALHAGVSRSAMTGILDGLERRGWVSRVRRGDDRRASWIELTTDGRAEAGALIHRFLHAASEIGMGLSLSDRSALIDECRLLAKRAAQIA